MTTKHILLVDDYDLNRKLLKRAIEKHKANYKVEVASDQQSALSQLERQKFDLIILDLVVSGANGLELAQTIRHSWPDIPLVLTTDCLADLPARRIAELNFDGYVKKPISSWRLYDLIDHFLLKEKYVATT